MIDKYKKGSIIQYENDDKFIVFESLKKDNEIYLLVMKFDGEITNEIVIDYNKLLLLKVLENDETVIESDENKIREIMNLFKENEKKN